MEEKVLTCFHCGNKTSMKQVSTHDITEHEEIWEYSYSPNRPVAVISYGKRWCLYLCPVCNEVTMERKSWFSEKTEPNGNPIVHEEIIYPTTGVTEHYIPKEVRDSFDAAFKVRHLDGAICVLALRRSLEKMCK